jgi:hypothetical protein
MSEMVATLTIVNAQMRHKCRWRAHASRLDPAIAHSVLCKVLIERIDCRQIVHALAWRMPRKE